MRKAGMVAPQSRSSGCVNHALLTVQQTDQLYTDTLFTMLNTAETHRSIRAPMCICTSMSPSCMIVAYNVNVLVKLSKLQVNVLMILAVLTLDKHLQPAIRKID